jgi:anti-sigma-K factor RskA
MNLSRPDRSERLDRLAAEYALGTTPPRVRRRLAAIARREPVVAAALADWEQRLAVLGDAVPGVTPRPRIWGSIVERLGLSAAGSPASAWWNRLAWWRGIAAASFVVALALAIVQLTRGPAPAAAPIIVVLAGTDAKPAIIATAAPGERRLILKAVIDTSTPPGKDLELWALPAGGAPKALGILPRGALVSVALPVPVDESLTNVPALAVSVEPAGGSPTGQPTGPVLYSGKVERMY